MRRAIVAGILSALAAASVAQPDPLAARPDTAAEPIDPWVLLHDVMAVYRAGPLADEVAVRVEDPQGRGRDERLVVRLDASEPGAPFFRLELGDLVIATDDGRVVAANTDNENVRFVRDFGGPVGIEELLSALPPLPLPQLPLAFADTARFESPTPYTRPVAWGEAQMEATPGGSFLRLRGRSEHGAVEAVFDGTTLRLRTFRAPIGGGRLLRIAAREVAAGDPGAWWIPTDGRRIVGELSDLSPQRGPLRVGDFVPDLRLTSGMSDPWSMGAALETGPLALVLFRLPGDAERIIANERAAELGVEALAGLGPDLIGPARTHVVAAFELAGFDRDRLMWLLERWGGDGRPRLLWSTAPAQTIARFDAAAGAVVAVIGPDRRLLASVPLDGFESAADAAAELRRALAP